MSAENRGIICDLETYSWASRAARRLSSSLYLVAALDWYFVLGSLLLSAAVPPFCWKNLVADSLPPTFITRSWSHCHSVPTRQHSFCKKVNMLASTYDRGSLIAQMRYGHQGFGGWRSNQGRGRCQRGRMSMLGSFGRSRSRSGSRRNGQLWSLLNAQIQQMGTYLVRRLSL